MYSYKYTRRVFLLKHRSLINSHPTCQLSGGTLLSSHGPFQLPHPGEFSGGDKDMFILMMNELCVEWGSTNTGWHITVYYVKNSHTCEVKHNGDKGMGHLCLYGWDNYGKVSYCSFWKYAEGLQVIAWLQVLVPLNSRPVAYSHLDEQYKPTASISCTYPNVIFDINSSSIIDDGF